MDQFVIKTPGLPLHDLFASEPMAVETALAEANQVGCSLLPEIHKAALTRYESGKLAVRLVVGPCQALRLFGLHDDSSKKWFLTKIEGNLPRLLYGDNAVPICSQRDLLVGLTRLRDVLSCFVPPRYHTRILPSLDAQNASYWRTVAFPVHLLDPDGQLLAAFQNLRHPGMRDPTRRFDGESVKLKGTAKSINVYRKDLETLNRYTQKEVPLPEIPVLRIECEWSGAEVVKRAANMGVEVAIEGESSRPRRFSLPLLYRMLRGTLAETGGVFLKENSSGDVRSMARFLGNLAKDHSIPLQNILDAYARDGGRSSRTLRDIRRDAERHLESLIELSITNLLPEDGPPLTPWIQVAKVKEEIDGMQLARLPDPEIARVYHDQFCPLLNGWFDPSQIFHAT